MTTINISLPEKLKSEAEMLVNNGYYVSFSDMVRASLRWLVERSKYDVWAEEAKKDLKKGRVVVLKSSAQIDKYLKKI